MTTLESIEGLSEVIGRAIQEHLERSNINVAWPQIDGLVRPILRVEAFLEDADSVNVSSQRSEKVASVSTCEDIPAKTKPLPLRSAGKSLQSYETLARPEQASSTLAVCTAVLNDRVG